MVPARRRRPTSSPAGWPIPAARPTTGRTPVAGGGSAGWPTCSAAATPRPCSASAACCSWSPSCAGWPFSARWCGRGWRRRIAVMDRYSWCQYASIRAHGAGHAGRHRPPRTAGQAALRRVPRAGPHRLPRGEPGPGLRPGRGARHRPRRSGVPGWPPTGRTGRCRRPTGSSSSMRTGSRPPSSAICARRSPPASASRCRTPPAPRPSSCRPSAPDPLRRVFANRSCRGRLSG